MTCLRSGNTILCGFGSVYEFEGYLFEWHHWHGPWPVTRKDPSEPRKTIPAGFWEAIERFQVLSEAERAAYLWGRREGRKDEL
jgi:hypothetical protein